MSYSNYKHDVFISYCHADNRKQFNDSVGWVDNFFENLRTSLLKIVGSKVSIWWDKNRIDGNTVFDDSIDEAVKNSAILICINSPTYLNSEYCEKELGLFYKENRDYIKVGDQSRIFNVLLYNIPYTEWPPEFEGTPGFIFHDSKNEDDKGHPMTMNCDQFKEAFLSFCDSVEELLKGIGVPPPPPPVFDIFFGEVEDNLRNLRKTTIDEIKKETITIKDEKTKNESRKQKFEVIAGVPPPFEKDKHEELVNEDLEKTELSVHLLDDVAGRNITEEEPICYPQRQAELSFFTTKPKFIWVPADINIETVKDENYKNFLIDLDNGTLPVTGHKYIRSLESELPQHVLDMVNNVYEEWLKNRGPGIVLVDTHYNDQVFGLDVYEKLVNSHLQPIFNPQEGNPKKNSSLLEERICQAGSLIFIYGKISCDWVTERIKIAMKTVIERKLPIQQFIVVRLPPYKDINLKNLNQPAIRTKILDNSNSLVLDQNVLLEILKSIKAIA